MTNTSEKFCLKWNDFQQNIASSYHDLREDTDFSDVTLVCEDDHMIEAHRIVLTACSPFFSNVLKKNKHPHPMIYMMGLKAKALVAVIDFIYYGETNIDQEDLDGFLALAEELQLTGLVRALKNELHAAKDQTKDQIQQIMPKETYLMQDEQCYQRPTYEESETDSITTFEDHTVVPVDASKLVGTNKENLKAQLDSMMVKAEDGEIKWICTACGKTTKGTNWGNAKSRMREHIETHIAGLSYPCSKCGKVSRTSSALRGHISANHF